MLPGQIQQKLKHHYDTSTQMADQNAGGEPLPPATQHLYCEECFVKNRDIARNRYRLAHGIPLDAPLGPGRPRNEPKL
jgi:hypothetical protein